jgi:hypothetical protein
LFSAIIVFVADVSDDRAEARRSWPVRRFRLGEEPGDDLSAQTTAEQRLAMMWELALSAWQLSGRQLPSYERASAPGCVIRPKT